MLAWETEGNSKHGAWLVGGISFCFSSFVMAQSTLPAAIPLKRDAGTDTMSGSSAAVLVVLAIILGLCFYYVNFRRKNPRQIGALAGKRSWWPRLASFSPANSRLKVIATVRLTNQSTLHEVQWGQKRILLVNSEHGVVKLDETLEPFADDHVTASQSGAA